ncbi:MAG: hypothetical protein M3014_00460 [Chloroflexota bacterium]|nr:hypothetical protein [Chloroflexota bacterium]
MQLIRNNPIKPSALVDSGQSAAVQPGLLTGSAGLPVEIATVIHRGQPPAWRHVAAVALISLATLAVGLGMWGWTYDDAFIIYRYARNFADGLGMVYNPSEHYLGTSSAGYTLLIAFLYKALPGLDLTVLGSLTSVAGIWVSGTLLYVLGVQARRPFAGLLAGIVTLANPLLLQSWGGEMTILVPLVIGSVYAYCRGWGIATGALLGGAVLTRQDSIVLVGLLGAHYIFTRRRIPWEAGVAFILIMLPWVTYSWFFFGSPLPGTLEAKISQGKAGWPFFLTGSISWFNDIIGDSHARSVLYLLAPLGALTLTWSAFRRQAVTPWLLLLGWCALFTAGYTALRVSFYHWYAVPAAVGIGILAVWGVVGIWQVIASMLSRINPRNAYSTPLARVVGSLVAGFLFLLPAARLYEYNVQLSNTLRGDSTPLYTKASNWLRDHTERTSTVAYLEIGRIGYYSGNRIIDPLGLITPGAAAHVPTWDYSWTVLHYKPDYYLAQDTFEPILRNISTEPWFISAYSQATTLKGGGHTMTIYHLNPGANLPQPLRPLFIQRESQQPAWITPGEPTEQWPGQTFASTAANLKAISLLIGIPKPVTQGKLVLHLRRSTGDKQDLRSAEAKLTDITNDSWYTFRFDALPDSAGQTYFFTTELVDYPKSTEPPLALWYATDDLYPGGTRYRGTKAVEGDLCMRPAVADTP